MQIGTVARYSEMCFARGKKKRKRTEKEVILALIAASRSFVCHEKTFSTSKSFLATSYSRSYFSPSRMLILLWYWFRMDFTLAVEIQVTPWKIQFHRQQTQEASSKCLLRSWFHLVFFSFHVISPYIYIYIVTYCNGCYRNFANKYEVCLAQMTWANDGWSMRVGTSPGVKLV